MPSPVALPKAASSVDALAHFTQRMQFATDCWDTHAALASRASDFVLLDVRSAEMYRQSHIPGAISLPHRKLITSKLQAWPVDTLFVVYCAGPHCNGANRAAIRLAELGRPVKEMLGGMTGWADEGFAFARGDLPGSVCD